MNGNLLLGRGIVIAFFATVLFVGVGAGIVINRYHSDARANQAVFGLQQIHKSARHWAEMNGGTYPDHVALLWSNVYFRPRYFKDPRGFSDTIWEVNGVDARPFMAELRDDVPENERLDRAPLIESVNSARDVLFYRFGDYWFARLPTYTGDRNLIFGWTRPDEEDRRFIVFDDGEALRVDRAQWTAAWSRDAEARARRGMPDARPDEVGETRQ